MRLPKIAPDDAALFGSLALFALGAALVVGAATASVLLALGACLIAFGLPSVLLIFLAAVDTPE